MLTIRFVVTMFSVSLMVLGAGVVSGQIFPNKPIRIVTSPAGGGNDFIARIIAQRMSVPLGQPVIVENRTTRLIPVIVAKAPPDGYTLLLTGGGFMLAPLLENVSYDPVRDFAPISMVDTAPQVLVVTPSLTVSSVSELIALAKTKPGVLNYASSGDGSPNHLAAELFKAMAGVNIVRINYKGSGPALNEVLGGQVQLMFTSAGLVVPHLKSGKLKGLAVTSARSSELVPGLPTVAATVPGYETIGISAIYAPAKTPASIINRLNQEIVRFLKTPEVKEKLLEVGSEVAPSSPEELAAKLQSELARWGKLIKDAGIRVQ